MIDSRLCLPLFVLFVACGPDSRESGGGDDDGVDAAPRCTDGTSTSTVMVGAGSNGVQAWSLDAVTNDGAVVVHHAESDGALRVAMIDRGASAATDLALLPGASGYRFTVAAVGTCAAIMSSKAGLYYACPGTAAEPAGLPHLDADHSLVPFEHSDGSLSIFMQSYASFTEVVRSAAGVWREIEQYESSISYPTDVVSVSGEPLVCFISSGDRAVLQLGEGHVSSTVEARTCKLALDGSTVHVLTDAGYAEVPISSITGGGSAPFTLTSMPALVGQTVVSLFVDDGVAQVLGRTADNKVVVTRLSDGMTTELGTLTSSSTIVQWDARQRAVHLVSSKLDTSGAGPEYPQTIANETRCVP